MDILIDGEKFWSGDEQSVRVLYRNLTGENFLQGSPASSFRSHAEYIEFMEAANGPLRGKALAIAENGKIIDTSLIPENPVSGAPGPEYQQTHSAGEEDHGC